MEMIVERCNDNLSECTRYPPLTRENICNDFNTTFYGPDFLTNVTPPLACPLQAVSRTLSTFCTNFEFAF